MKKSLFAIALLAMPLASFAQNINPSVQVSNEYDSGIIDARKIGVEMSVPDTLLTFDYNFDYTVFESPFKGAYEFSPYSIQITPEETPFDGRKMYLRAGAGYYLNPDIDFVWAPVANPAFGLGVYAKSGGYFYSGDYLDLAATAGAEGRWIAGKSIVTFAAGYDGFFEGEQAGHDFYSSGFARLGLKSASEGSYLYYDINALFRTGTENLNVRGRLDEQLFRIYGTAGPVIRNRYRFLVDFDFNHTAQKGLASNALTFVSLQPHVAFLLGQVSVKAGVKFDYMTRLSVVPVVDASFGLFNDKTSLFVGFKGGQKFRSQFDYKNMNHRYNPYWMFRRSESGEAFADMQTVTVEKLNTYAGIRGYFGSHFQYSFKVGYSILRDDPFEYVCAPGRLGYVFNDINMAYAGLLLSWKSDAVEVLADLKCNRAELDAEFAGFAPSSFSGTASVRYNWHDRMRFCVSAEGASSRKSYAMDGVADVPAYVDLSVSAEYNINARWGVWMKGGNLLGQHIQRIPLYEEKGPYFTVGMTLSL